MSNINTELLLSCAGNMNESLSSINKKLKNLEAESKDQYDEYSNIMNNNGTRIGWNERNIDTEAGSVTKYDCSYVDIYAQPDNMDRYTYIKNNYDGWVLEMKALGKAISYIVDNAYYIDILYGQIVDILEPEANLEKTSDTKGQGFNESYKKKALELWGLNGNGYSKEGILPLDLGDPFAYSPFIMQALKEREKNELLDSDKTTEDPLAPSNPIKEELGDVGIDYDDNNRNYEKTKDDAKKVESKNKIAQTVKASSDAVTSINNKTIELENKYDSNIVNSDSYNDNNKIEKLSTSAKDVYKVNNETKDNTGNSPLETPQVLVEQQIGAAKPIVGVAQQVTNAGGSIPAKADTNSTLSYNPVTNDDDSTMVSYNDSKPYVDGQNNNSSVISVSDNKGLNNIIPGVAAVVAGTGVGLAVKGKLDEDKDEEYEIEG